MSVIEITNRRSVRERLWNPPNGRVSDELEVMSPSSYRTAEAVAQRRRITDENDKMRAELRDTREQLEAAHITIRKQSDRIAAMQFIRADIPADATDRYFKQNTMKGIVSAVSEHLGLSIGGIMSVHRTKKLVYARHLSFYVASKVTTLSLVAIGRRLDRDHTTVMHGIKQIEAQLSTNPAVQADFDAIKARLEGG